MCYCCKDSTKICKRVNALFLFCAFLIVLLAGCQAETNQSYSYHRPTQTDDGFIVGSLKESNMDENILASAVVDIQNGKYGEIHALLIYKEDKLVFEEYFPGHEYLWDDPDFHGGWINWGIGRRHNIHSAGKSITSACIGIALDQGYIDSVDQSIFDYLPNHQHLNTGVKGEITIEHLLTMTSGLAWDEWGTSYANENNDVIALWMDCNDPITCILEKPLISTPGTSFTYSGGNIIILGEIIKNSTGMDIETFSWEYLFEPLGIKTPPWRWIDDTGIVYAGGDQQLTPREMLKFGVTYLDDGKWNGKQIVSKEWVENSAEPYSGSDNRWFNHPLRPIPPGDGTWGLRGYSYTWWTHLFFHAGKKIPAFWAFGWGGQKIIVFPDQNAVVVFTGANYTSADHTAKILVKYVIPSFDLR